MLQLGEYANNGNLYEAGQSHVKIRAAPTAAPSSDYLPIPCVCYNPILSLPIESGSRTPPRESVCCVSNHE